MQTRHTHDDDNEDGDDAPKNEDSSSNDDLEGSMGDFIGQQQGTTTSRSILILDDHSKSRRRSSLGLSGRVRFLEDSSTTFYYDADEYSIHPFAKTSGIRFKDDDVIDEEESTSDDDPLALRDIGCEKLGGGVSSCIYPFISSFIRPQKTAPHWICAF